MDQDKKAALKKDLKKVCKQLEPGTKTLLFGMFCAFLVIILELRVDLGIEVMFLGKELQMYFVCGAGIFCISFTLFYNTIAEWRYGTNGCFRKEKK